VTFRNDPPNDLRILSADPGNPESIQESLPSRCPADTAKPAWFREFFGLPDDTDALEAPAKRASGRAPGLSMLFREFRRP
jgi:hypothetical protein